MKKNVKIMISSASILAASAGIATGVVLAPQSTTNNTTQITNDNVNQGGNTVTTPSNPVIGNGGSNESVNTGGNTVTTPSNQETKYTQNGGVVKSNNLSFAAVVKNNEGRMMSGRTVTSNPKIPVVDDGAPAVGSFQKQVNMGENSITPEYTSGYVASRMENGEYGSRYVSSEYYNNRTLMPILDSSEHFTSNERTSKEIAFNDYRGWTKSEITNHNKQFTYTANEYLVAGHPELENKVINAVIIDGSKSIDQVNASINQFPGVEFIIIDGIGHDFDFGGLKLPENLLKLTLKGSSTDINALKLPQTLQEIEIYLGTELTQVNPLIFPKNTNIITDIAMARGISSIFKEIKLVGKDINNTSDKLQNAIDAVYQYRIKERAFQGVSAGGYIGSWNLRETNVDSFNNVTIPVLNDGTGRFYIAHVEVETIGHSPVKDETISSKPSNDSQINDWFDWGEGWNMVTEVIVSSSEPVDISVATGEIMGFLAKYPNIQSIDIRGIELKADEFGNVPTHETLKNSVLESIKGKYGKDSPFMKIVFILPWEL